MNKKCKSLEETQSINDRCAYVNLPLSLQDFCIKHVSRSAIVLWTKIRALVGKSSDWSILISNSALGKMMGRAAHTIYVQLRELENIGLIEKIGSPGKRSVIKVRFPQSLDQTKIIWRTKSKNEGGQRVRSYYINNNTNNSAKSTEQVPTAPASPPVVDNSHEIGQLEKKKVELDRIFTELGMEIVKNPSRVIEIFEKQKKVGNDITHIDLKIDRLKPRPVQIAQKIDYLNLLGDIVICQRAKSQLIAQVPEKVRNEIAFSARRGDLGRGNLSRGIFSGIKLFRENRWETPTGMPQ